MNINIMPEGKSLIVDDVRIQYYEEGTGDVILMIHGWPQTSWVWRKIFPELKKNYRVIAIDLPGTGESGPAPAYDTKSIATLISHFMQELQIDQFHLIGHDVGSWVSAAFGLHFQARLKTLTVIDAGIPGLISPDTFKPENAAKIWQFYFHAIKDIPEFLIEGKERAYLSWYFTNKSHVENAITADDLELYVKAFKSNHGFGYYRSFAESASQNLLVTEKIRVPVLAVGGEFAMGNGTSMAMSKIADKVEMVSLKSSGHYVPEEQPEKLLELILKNIAEA